jgi:hypothetical protein
MGQQRPEARRVPGPEALRRHKAFAKVDSRRLKRSAEIAEAVVNAQPEARHFAEIGVGRPCFARKPIEEQPEVVRPALAGIEIEVHVEFLWRVRGAGSRGRSGKPIQQPASPPAERLPAEFQIDKTVEI